jgi:hypothetical protein
MINIDNSRCRRDIIDAGQAAVRRAGTCCAAVLVELRKLFARRYTRLSRQRLEQLRATERVHEDVSEQAKCAQSD